MPLSFFESGVELQISQIFQHILTGSASKSVYDVGMNTGYYTLLSASHGARVTAFEPQPLCVNQMRSWLEGVDGHLLDNITVVNVAVGHLGTISVPGNQCDSRFGPVLPEGLEGAKHKILQAPLLALLPLHHHVTLIKCDTEGAEVSVIHDVLRLARNRTVDNFIVELVPMWWERRGGNFKDGISYLSELQSLAAETVLLSDPTPFSFQKTAVALPSDIKGDAFMGFNMSDLAHDRVKSSSGCNVWFRFSSP